MKNIFLAATVFSTVLAASHQAELAWLKKGVDDPIPALRERGTLVSMGNSSLDDARIVFLPEIHDDPQSLTTQFLLLAREKKQNRRFIILDESLAPLKKSMWDIFSQKSLEILAAVNERRNKRTYAPERFESALQNLATKFRQEPGHLNFIEGASLWSLSDFKNHETPFYGWDLARKGRLIERNLQMVESLKAALKTHDRVFVMAGARHIPDLEFLSSQKLLCQKSRSTSKDSYFANLEQKFGAHPDLTNGVGATLPIHKFLAGQKYAVVFNDSFYKELDGIVAQFQNSLGNACLHVGG